METERERGEGGDKEREVSKCKQGQEVEDGGVGRDDGDIDKEKQQGTHILSFWEDQSQWYIWKTSICFIPSSISINHCASQIGVLSLSTVLLFATLWIVARQAPLPMGFSRQEHWSG